jgi:endonuclease VIII
VPEGDTVYRTARLLDRSLSGQRLTLSDFRVPQLATTDLVGGTVTGTVSRGKHLLTRIDGGPELDGEAWTLHTHLKMEGSWRVHAPGRRWSRPAHQVRVVLGTETAVAVGYSLGIVELLPRDREDDAVGHLGPDLLGPDWDEAEALRRLTEDPARPVGEALLDQRNLAGIGNMWMAEALFLTGINPYLSVPEVPDLCKVVRMSYRLLQANKERAVQASTGSTRRGQERYVYGRAGQPCRRCGTRIRSSVLGPVGRERVTYWCPSCQPMP